MMDLKCTERFDEVEIGDIIEVSFTNEYTTGPPDIRRGIVDDLKYDEFLKSDVIVFGSFIVARHKSTQSSATNIITDVIKKEINPEYWL